MDITRCSCSRFIHRYSSDKEKCPFCGIATNTNNSINDPFTGSPSFIKGVIAQIDDCINEAKYEEASKLIDEALEWAPGWKIGETPGSGEIYWRKLLADNACKNDTELLRKGKLLQKNTAFVNALEYADDNERPAYMLVKQTEDLTVKLLETALAEKELEEKRNTEVEHLLIKYEKELIAAKQLAQGKITELEEVEKSMLEHVIDCNAIKKEYEQKLNNLRINATNIGNPNAYEISQNEKEDWEEKLDAILLESNTEINNLTKLEYANARFIEYSRILEKQRSVASEINVNISGINGIQQKIQELLSRVELIANKYAEARTAMHKGSYELAASILSTTRLNEIVRQAMSAPVPS